MYISNFTKIQIIKTHKVSIHNMIGEIFYNDSIYEGINLTNFSKTERMNESFLSTLIAECLLWGVKTKLSGHYWDETYAWIS